MYVYKKQEIKIGTMDKDIREGMKLGRTREGTVFEVVAALLIIIMWATSAWLVSHRGADIEQQVINCGMATAAVLVVLFTAYRPDLINFPVVITTPAQLRLLVRLRRIAALEVIAMFFGVNLAIALDGSDKTLLAVVMAISAVMLATVVCGVFMVNKCGN